jgi:Lysylphosphatidylglycerol synthase TM region
VATGVHGGPRAAPVGSADARPALSPSPVRAAESVADALTPGVGEVRPEAATRPAQGGLLGRWLQRAARLRSANERAFLGVAAAMFVVASIVASQNLPDVPEWRWWLLALVPLVGAPLTVLSNAWEYRVIASLLRHRVGPLAALRVSVLSSAANLLPIPGAMLVRATALRAMGTGYGRAISVTALVGIARVGVAGVMAGALQMFFADVLFGTAVLIGGLAVFSVFVTAVIRHPAVAGDPPHIAAVVAVETTAVAVGSLRLWLVLHGLGFDATVPQAVALSTAGVLGSVLGFFPAGLGVRELLAAAIGPAVGLPASVSLVVTAVDRVCGLIVLAIMASALSATGGTRSIGEAVAGVEEVARPVEGVPRP